jgi:5-methyltetrahydropteroyltriglutamate--homocysteine methyltransferase
VRNDPEVGGRSWLFYAAERLGGVVPRSSSKMLLRGGLRPGQILYEVEEAWNSGAVARKITRGPLEFAAIWKTAQKMTDKPVKFGTVCATTLPLVLYDEHYGNDHELMMDLAAVLNEELKEVAAAGCQVIQIEAPSLHFGCNADPAPNYRDLHKLVDAFNRQVEGLNTEVWAHTCWGNPNQQSFSWERPGYERSLGPLLDLNIDALMLECASSQGRDLPLLRHHRTGTKIAVGVINHTVTTVEPPEMVAGLVRKALEYVAPERLIVTADCGFGREVLSRRIGHYKCVALVEGVNLVRKELGLPEVYVSAADPRFAFYARL